MFNDTITSFRYLKYYMNAAMPKRSKQVQTVLPSTSTSSLCVKRFCVKQKNNIGDT